MDIKTKIFWFIMGLLIFFSFGLTAYRYLIKKDYIIQAQTDCDPYTETCFIWNCDPESQEEGEKCTGDPEADIWYYKIISRNASKIPVCDINDENCRALVCEANEPECEFTLCNEETMAIEEVEACSDPTKYSLENPVDEECEEGDEECLGEEEEIGEDGEGGETEAEDEEDPAIQTTDDIISSQKESEEEDDSIGNLPIVESEIK